MDLARLAKVLGDIDIGCLQLIAAKIMSGELIDDLRSGEDDVRRCLVNTVGVLVMALSGWMKQGSKPSGPVFGSHGIDDDALMEIASALNVEMPMGGVVTDAFREVVWKALLSLIEAKLPEWIELIKDLAEAA